MQLWLAQRTTERSSGSFICFFTYSIDCLSIIWDSEHDLFGKSISNFYSLKVKLGYLNLGISKKSWGEVVWNFFNYVSCHSANVFISFVVKYLVNIIKMCFYILLFLAMLKWGIS